MDWTGVCSTGADGFEPVVVGRGGPRLDSRGKVTAALRTFAAQTKSSPQNHANPFPRSESEARHSYDWIFRQGTELKSRSDRGQ